MPALKTVRQEHQVSPELLRLLDEFRRMVNVCIAVEIEENVSSLKTLSLRSYHRLSSDILGYYRLGAISVATGDTSRLSKGQEEETADKVSICEKNDVDYMLRVQDTEWMSQTAGQTTRIHLR